RTLRGTTGTAALQRCARVAGAVPTPTPVPLAFAGIAHILPQQSANHAASLPIVALVRQPLGDCQGLMLSTTLDPLCGLPGYVASGFYPQPTASIRFIQTPHNSMH